jgi:hypothetical protein
MFGVEVSLASLTARKAFFSFPGMRDMMKGF